MAEIEEVTSPSRAAGILLHPTSLPGPGGIGSLGPHAYWFVDTLQAAGMRVWQVLPLGPTGYADSPYAALSAFAGNPLLIALEPLVARGLLEPGDLELPVSEDVHRVDFGAVVPTKMATLRRAFQRFEESRVNEPELADFVTENQSWLEDYALYMAIKDAQGLAPWIDWPEPLRWRQPAALAAAREQYAADLRFHRWVQLLFFLQWRTLKWYTNDHGIGIVGDIPIFVAYDSADVWAHQDLFQLDASGRPIVVAGVPPDYFSETGQLWGNPHYRWDALAARGYDWWIERFQSLLKLVDVVRLDHFRGFAGAWEIPYGNETAVEGEWVAGPGRDLFAAIGAALGRLPIIAEDLGVITPDVVALRREFGFPGMKILQFAFSSGPSDASLPHHYTHDSVVYTGTHDNDTTVGWFEKIPPEERQFMLQYLGTDGSNISWELMRLALASVSDLAVVPLQDVLRLGSEARMNLPGSMSGNWTWRFAEGDITAKDVAGLCRLTYTYGRSPQD